MGITETCDNVALFCCILSVKLCAKLLYNYPRLCPKSFLLYILFGLQDLLLIDRSIRAALAATAAPSVLSRWKT